jgi:cation transport regulator ChaC
MRLGTPRAVKRLRLAVMLRSWPLARLWYRLHGIRLEGRPGESIWYFAYGANMHDGAFRDRRGMQPAEWRVGRLPGYRLRFNLDGRPKGKSAPANISEHPRHEVWGVLYRITRRDLVRLNASEGIPGRRYRPIELPAEDAAGNRLNAVAYIADGNDEDGNPSLRYLTLLREGAREHGLPEHWLARLDEIRHWE